MDFRRINMRLFFRKILTFSLVILPAILAIPIVIIIRLLRPIVLVRFIGLSSSRIGHFAADTELYLCEQDAGMHGKRTLDFFYYSWPVYVCNQQLKKMWARVLDVSSFACVLAKANSWLPGYEVHATPRYLTTDVHNLFGRIPSHLYLTSAEERRGSDALKMLGIPEDATFICVHARDSNYLDIKLRKMNGDWRYHDCRNADINGYIPAAEELTRRGHYVIRMGAVVKEPLKTDNPRIIDYATKGRNDFLDIYLSAKCRFFLGSSAGLTAVPRIFRVPVAYANYLPLASILGITTNALFVPKKLWLHKEGRFLTYREIFDSGIQDYLGSHEYAKAGIEILDNTPEEVMALAMEMEERIDGSWHIEKEDEELQRRFWSFFRTRSHCRFEYRGEIPGVRIGAEFLRQNRNLLE